MTRTPLFDKAGKAATAEIGNQLAAERNQLDGLSDTQLRHRLVTLELELENAKAAGDTRAVKDVGQRLHLLRRYSREAGRLRRAGGPGGATAAPSTVNADAAAGGKED